MEISESLEQILDATDLFGESFYELFLSTYPEVQEYFEGVNMSRQAIMGCMSGVVVVRRRFGHLTRGDRRERKSNKTISINLLKFEVVSV